LCAPPPEKRERRRVLITQRTLEDSSPLPFLFIMTLECGKTVFQAFTMREHSRIFREFPAPTYAILPQRGKTKLLSTQLSANYWHDQDGLQPHLPGQRRSIQICTVRLICRLCGSLAAERYAAESHQRSLLDAPSTLFNTKEIGALPKACQHTVQIWRSGRSAATNATWDNSALGTINILTSQVTDQRKAARSETR